MVLLSPPASIICIASRIASLSLKGPEHRLRPAVDIRGPECGAFDQRPSRAVTDIQLASVEADMPQLGDSQIRSLCSSSRLYDPFA